LNFHDRTLKNTQIPKFMTIRPVADKLFHVDGQTYGQMARQADRQAGRQVDRHEEANIAFHNFANVPIN
jgi:hypothetical protein